MALILKKEWWMTDDRDEQIRRRAYEIWEALGRPEGGQQQHWAQAEAEILADECTGTGSAPGRGGGAGPRWRTEAGLTGFRSCGRRAAMTRQPSPEPAGGADGAHRPCHALRRRAAPGRQHPLPPVGARCRGGDPAARAGRRPPALGTPGRRLVRPHRGGRAGGHALSLPPGRRHGRAGPGLARASGRALRPVPGLRPAGL